MVLLTHTDALIGAMVDLIVQRCAPERVVLFGSRARGEADEFSDYDLLVIVPDEAYYKGLSVDIRRDLDTLPRPKDLVVAKRSTIDRQGHIAGTVYHDALQEGITLYATT